MIYFTEINKPFLLKDCKILPQRPIHLDQNQLSQSFLEEYYRQSIIPNLLQLFSGL